MNPGRVMVVGAVGAGKTSLIRALTGGAGPVPKTQAMEYQANSIDTPGEFAENPFFYRALFSTSLEAEAVVFVQDAIRVHSVFPPGFARAFPRPTIGVMTKIDHPEADVERARLALEGTGLNGPVFSVSAVTGEGIDELRLFLGHKGR